ncbi:MAG: hypothetical protein IJ065_04565 [Eubacterium sp.]|nr:hypothetical protein [Eubacterium sp.]
MIKKIKGTGFALMMSLLMMAASGCSGKKESDSERAPIEQEKNISRMVNEAGKAEAEGTEDYTTDDAIVEEGTAAEYKKIDEFNTKLTSDNGLIQVEVDAPVSLTECNSYPIVKVSRDEIDEGLLKKTKNILLGDTTLYDGVRVMDPDIERDIKSGVIGDAEKDELMIGGQVYYDAIGQHPVDVSLRKVADMAEEYSDVENFDFYYNQLMPEGELFYGVTDGRDGEFASLCVTNSDSYGSSLKYFSSRDYFVRSGLVLPEMDFAVWPTEYGKDYIVDDGNPERLFEPEEPSEPEYDENGEIVQWVGSGKTDSNFEGFNIIDSTKETNNLSKEEALRQAEEVLKELGLDNQYVPAYTEDSYLTDPFNVVKASSGGSRYTEDVTVGRVWDIVYERGVNGNTVENFGEKYSENYYHGEVDKQVWFGESVRILVNDNGVVGLFINDPMTAEETVVDNSNLLGFDEIKKIYEETQLETLNGMSSFDSILSEEAGDLMYDIKIDDIKLRYTKVSEPENFNNGLLVPVWDFSGVCYNGQGDVEGEGSFIQINAIDGSVYNAEAGY